MVCSGYSLDEILIRAASQEHSYKQAAVSQFSWFIISDTLFHRFRTDTLPIKIAVIGKRRPFDSPGPGYVLLRWA
jgi:hypothetical protein